MDRYHDDLTNTDLREAYYEELRDEREARRMERDNDACGYYPPEEKEADHD